MNRLSKIAAAALAVTVGLSGCVSTNAAAGGDATCGFKIGYFGALTGDNANIGLAPRDGAKLAVDQYNAKHADCTAELVNFDSQGDPKQAPGLAQQIVQDPKVLGVVGPGFSGESEAANPILNQGGVTIITPSATRPSLASQGWQVFHRAVGNDATQGPAAGKYLQGVLKTQKTFVIDDTGAYGKGLADEVRTVLGAAVVKSATIQPKQTDFSAVVTEIKSTGADAVFFGGYYAEAGPLLRQMRTAGIKATFVAGDGVKDQGLIEGAGVEAAQGAVLTCPCTPAEKAKGTFPADFKAAFGRDAGTYSAEGYDAANILLAGLESGATTRKALLDFVKGYSGEGVAGRYKFDATGENDISAVSVWAYKVEGEAIVADQQIPLG
ncbi:branched-chain amino acid ABC transporter substrate-binding protein [Catenuloplanes indicus]|uniref:Branched-chain amino acid transport system substrate-binding protein n=1 Tax=Catenuloplanes indicus TaxID=137267 RepID=A0AAE3W7N1_9ACTN|nr:branched-chain amino acid ABC transporter substrate-binding protein [Catenuloplanes indicus]MDQ0369940.1 branched-chain amino acid transport system substrate-binding protein [Catenuloplanes indicus]